MGTVHLLRAASASPEELRRRFDRVFLEPDSGVVSPPLPQPSVDGAIFFWPLQVADNVFRDASLFWLALTREQLRFCGLIP